MWCHETWRNRKLWLPRNRKPLITKSDKLTNCYMTNWRIAITTTLINSQLINWRYHISTAWITFIYVIIIINLSFIDMHNCHSHTVSMSTQSILYQFNAFHIDSINLIPTFIQFISINVIQSLIINAIYHQSSLTIINTLNTLTEIQIPYRHSRNKKWNEPRTTR